MVRMVMRGGGGRWLETQGEEGGVMRASEDASLDMESSQNVRQAPPSKIRCGKAQRTRRQAREDPGGQGDIALALSLG